MKPHKIFNNLLVYLSLWTVIPEPDELTFFLSAICICLFNVFTATFFIWKKILAEFVNNNLTLR